MTLKQCYIELLNRILNKNNLVENYLENMGEQIDFSFDSIFELEKDDCLGADLVETTNTPMPNKLRWCFLTL